MKPTLRAVLWQAMNEELQRQNNEATVDGLGYYNPDIGFGYMSLDGAVKVLPLLDALETAVNKWRTEA